MLSLDSNAGLGGGRLLKVLAIKCFLHRCCSLRLPALHCLTSLSHPSHGGAAAAGERQGKATAPNADIICPREKAQTPRCSGNAGERPCSNAWSCANTQTLCDCPSAAGQRLGFPGRWRAAPPPQLDTRDVCTPLRSRGSSIMLGGRKGDQNCHALGQILGPSCLVSHVTPQPSAEAGRDSEQGRTRALSPLPCSRQHFRSRKV